MNEMYVMGHFCFNSTSVCAAESKQQQPSYTRLTNEITLGFQGPNDTQLAQNEDCAHGFISCKHTGREETTYQSKDRTPFKAVATLMGFVSIFQLNRGFLFHFT